MKTKSAPTLYTLKEVAEILCVSTRTVARWINEGYLNAIRVGRLTRISEKDLDDLFEKHRASVLNPNIPYEED